MYSNRDIKEFDGEIFIRESVINTSFDSFEVAFKFLLKISISRLTKYLQTRPQKDLVKLHKILSQIIYSNFYYTYDTREATVNKNINWDLIPPSFINMANPTTTPVSPATRSILGEAEEFLRENEQETGSPDR